MELDADAMVKEGGAQMGSLAARNMILAGMLAAAQKKIQEQAEEIEALKDAATK